MKAALVFTYGRPAVGREAMAMDVFADSLVFWGKLAADGTCDEPMVYLRPDGGGMMIIHGERPALRNILDTEDFRRIYFRAGFAVPDLRYELLTAGDTVGEYMAFWAGLGSELGVM